MTDIDHAIQALRQGDQRTAFEMLRTILAQNPKDATAWLWMSEATADPQRKLEALSRFLTLAPDHPRAPSVRLRLQNLQAQQGQHLPTPVASGGSFPPLPRNSQSPIAQPAVPMMNEESDPVSPAKTLGNRINKNALSTSIEAVSDTRAELLSPYPEPPMPAAPPLDTVPTGTTPAEPSVRESIPIPPFTPRPAAPPPPDFAVSPPPTEDDGLPVWVWGLMLLAILTVIAFIYAIVMWY